MTPKEALNNMRSTVKKELNFPLNLTEEYKIINQALTELEELKRDVKRYFELEGNYQKSSHEYYEMKYIKNKLMEVGEKDE